MTLNFSKRIVFTLALIGISYSEDSFSLVQAEEDTPQLTNTQQVLYKGVVEKKVQTQEISPKSRNIVFLLSPLSSVGIPDFYLGKNTNGLIKLVTTVIVILCVMDLQNPPTDERSIARIAKKLLQNMTQSINFLHTVLTSATDGQGRLVV